MDDRSNQMWQEWRSLIGDQQADPLEVARLAGTFEKYFDAAKTHAVKAARATGRTWDEVAAAVGVTRQSAWQRYRMVESLANRAVGEFTIWPEGPPAPEAQTG